MKNLLILISSVILFSPSSKADLVISKEFEFGLSFPVTAEPMKMDHPLGPLISYAGVDEERMIIYQAQAQKAKFLDDLKTPSKETIKELTLTNFEAYIKESEGLNVKWGWMSASDWPIIEFSCEQVGFIKEGLSSYKRGYCFIKNGKFFKLTISGIQANQDLKPAATKFMASFFIPDRSMIDAVK